MTVKKDMTIAEVLKIKPDAAKVLMSFGMHCIGCAIASGETIDQAAGVHGINVDDLLVKLNESNKGDK